MKNHYTLIKRVMLLGSLLLFLGSIVTPQANAQLMKTSPEGQALMALYNATGGASWTNNTNWDSDTEPLENWYGVTVKDGKVTRLRLVTNNLDGSLPVEIGNLTDLTFLHLKENLLTNPVPVELGNLVNLTFLGLNDNQFTGPLPAAFSALTGLKELYIQKNTFTGTFPDISGFTNLLYLYISENNFDAFASPGITSVTTLYELRVHENNFVFEDLLPLIGLADEPMVYAPQKKFGTATTYNKTVGDALSIDAGLITVTNAYQWYKDGGILAGKTSNPFTIASLVLGDAGVYYSKVTNAALPLLTLTMEDQTVVVVAGLSVFPDWYITSSDGSIQVVIDAPAVVTPAVEEAWVYTEVFNTGVFEYQLVTEAIDFTVPAAPGPEYIWEADGIDPQSPMIAVEKTHRIKIKMVDANGLMSDLSDMQQSIHLTASVGITWQVANLIWTPYLGKDVDYYEVYGADDIDDLGLDPGPFSTGALLASLPNTETTFSDVYWGYNFYLVKAVFVITPGAMKSDHIKASSSNVLSTVDYLDEFEAKMTIYPNPVKDMATIKFDNISDSEYTMYLLDLSGKVVIKKENITGNQFTIDRGNLRTGIYIVQMVGDKTINAKMVIE